MTYAKRLSLVLLVIMLGACSSIIEKQSAKFSDNLSAAILNFDDPETVAAAIPTLLLINESFARQEDASANTLLTSAQMFAAYSGAFVNDAPRRAKLNDRAFSYALRGSCKQDKKWCNIDQLSQENFEQFVSQLNADDVSTAYTLATTWLGYIETHASDWSAVAQLSKTKALLEAVIKFNEAYDHGGAHLYLGALASTLPQALGGQPEVAKAHFEKALAISNGENLLVNVEYARRYARNTFNKALHHQLLTSVINSNPYVTDLTLMNTWAIAQAEALLADENDYFD